MKSRKWIRLWLLALIVIVGAGCSVEVRESSTRFQDTALPKAPEFSRVQLPVEPDILQVFDDGTVRVDLMALEVFVEAAWANNEVLDHRETQIRKQTDQVRALILLGRQTEEESALFRELYLNEANHGRLFKVAVFGTGSILLTLLGVAAL